jgi:ABC-2 type transport system permease protein/oleandomycin transport system permease protein
MKNNLTNTLSDVLVLTRRNLLKYRRIPQLIVFSSIQPVMMLLLFTYVFGGAIVTGSDEYIKYLLPGIIVQTVLFGSMQTGVGLADDLSKGMIDRFRSLPMARLAVLAGRTIGDAIRNIVVVLLMTVVGFLLGFRIEDGFLNFALALGLVLLFGFAFSWVSATIGLAVKNVETVQSAGFIWVFPLAFASSIFVPLESMSGAVKVFATYNPISYTVNTVRGLSLDLPIGHDWIWSLAWIAGLLAVFVPLAVSRFRKIS